MKHSKCFCYWMIRSNFLRRGSPYRRLREPRGDNKGLNLILLLLDCANFVASGNITNAEALLEYISQLASPDGDSLQRMATYFSEALACRVVRHLPGVYKALNFSRTSTISEERCFVQKLFFELCPFLQLAYLVMNQAIFEAMEGEDWVHIIDLHCSEPTQWIELLRAFKIRQGGPPHLKITGIHEKKEVLDQMSIHLAEEAGKLDFPLQFNPIVSRLEDLDTEILHVKTGEALSISSVLQLHSLLATDDEMIRRNSPSPSISPSLYLQRAMQMNQRTFGDMLERDTINMYFSSPDSSVSPLSLSASPKLVKFLNSLQRLKPKLMVIVEQEFNLNECSLVERVDRAMHFYGSLFDCLQATVARMPLERQKLERMLLGEEIKNIVAYEGAERKERYEKLEKWIVRMQMAGFCRIPLSYEGMLKADKLLQSYGHKYKLREVNECLFVCWSDRPLFSVSAWKFR